MKRTLALALVGVVGLVGCGGDDNGDGDSASVSEDVTTEQYALDVTERCATYQETMSEAASSLEDVGQPSSLTEEQFAEHGDTIKELHEINRTTIDDLAAMPRPAANADELETIFVRLDAMKAEFDGADAAIDAADADGLGTAYDGLNSAIEEAQDAPSYAELGFDACD